ncbi:MAG: ABC-F family ATP-binding cassette domain-containing protein [Elusimicrobiota bacterium]|nr:ABC-F family ATP-binding cassette domain-containing protein [Elusimicrobiota bacterium]
MAILLSCQNLSKSFGSRPLFEGLSFGLSEGERTGLIGPNGTGKSTLLKILAGRETPDAGAVTPRRGLRLGYLAQQDRFETVPPGWSARDEIMKALEDLGLEDYEADRRADEGLAAAGFADPAQQVCVLSGGWRKRLAILAQSVREPDLLLLDEPTNHLDIEGVLWLERFISEIKFPFLVVTHDRSFLERVTNRVIELNKRYPEGHFNSAGNYSKFLENREAFFDAQASLEGSLRNIVRTEIAWLRRGARARMTKQKAHIERAGGLIKELSELEYHNAQGRAADIDFNAGDRQANRLIHAVKIEKSLGGRKLFGPLDLTMGPGEKLGLLGGNGSGKTTLLKLLAGQLAPDAGTLKQAQGLRVVTFDQHRDQLNLDLTLKRALCGNGENVFYKGSAIHVCKWASRFLFRQEQLDMPLRLLSGGEQARVLIAGFMLQPADVLLLDEPTNDLDLQSLEVLENSMQEFPGALVLVTHDRYLLERVSRRLLALDGRGNARFFADLSQWESWREQQQAGSAAAAEPAPAPAQEPSAKENRELKAAIRKLEAEMQNAENQAAKARLSLQDPSIAADAEELAARQKKLDEALARTETLFARWSAIHDDK